MSSTTSTDVSALWLPLLRELSRSSPRWGIWKNADAALRGSGDIDSTAPKEDWPTIESAFLEWARAQDFDHVVSCTHVVGVLFLVAIDRSSRTLHELDVNARKYFRGWTMFRPQDLTPLMEMDPRGFRRVRPGAEALILLTQNGTRWGGRPDREGMKRKEIESRLAEDPEGVDAAAELFGSARRATRRHARAVSEGGWDRSAALKMELRAVLGAAVEPHVALTRLWARHIKKRCPVLRSIFVDDRQLPGDLDLWMEEASAQHRVWSSG